MNVVSICYAPLCGHRVIGQARVCPRCGGRMRSPRTIRAFGAVMMGSGLFITALMFAVTSHVPLPVAVSEVDMFGAAVAGGFAQARTAQFFFWFTIAFGIGSAAAGAWQTFTARRDPLVTMMVLALTGLLVFAARILQASVA